MHFEGLVFDGLPFMEAGLAECDAFGLGAATFGRAEVDDGVQNLFVVRP